MTHIIAIAFPKGGAGKSVSAVSLAAISADRGLKTLLIDFDPIGVSSSNSGLDKYSDLSASKLLADSRPKVSSLIQPSPFGYDVIVAGEGLLSGEKWMDTVPMGDLEIRAQLEEDESLQQYDVIYLDSPPHNGKILSGVLIAATHVISPLKADNENAQVLPLFINLSSSVNRIRTRFNMDAFTQLSYVFTDVDERTNITAEIKKSVRESLDPGAVAETVIPHSTAVKQAGQNMMPVVHFKPKEKPSIAYNRFFDEVLQPLFFGPQRKATSHESVAIA